ncbi:tetratricopeptide repeat protein [Zavarzinia compransoris]|uniref:tetratricopeptide repeat protein n=1 Tax=Zavarzinia marina TaxID=2911065 RepID=UPI001F2938B7|nr:tetratricopeptide repeat protein [Zavarzinia marina]MCF4164695.1 tetratricopeptide repeat protein [Zavarzinia marina]
MTGHERTDAAGLAARFQAALARGAHGEALPLAERLLVLMPDHAGLHYNRGLLLRKLGRDADAVPAFDAALALDRHHANALFEKAAALFDLGAVETAAALFTAYLDMRPEDADARLNLGNALLGLGRAGDALGHLRRAHAQAPSPLTIRALAVALRDTGDLAGCRAMLGELPADEPQAAALRLKILTQGAKGALRLDPAQFPPAR